MKSTESESKTYRAKAILYWLAQGALIGALVGALLFGMPALERIGNAGSRIATHRPDDSCCASIV